MTAARNFRAIADDVVRPDHLEGEPFSDIIPTAESLDAQPGHEQRDQFADD